MASEQTKRGRGRPALGDYALRSRVDLRITAEELALVHSRLRDKETVSSVARALLVEWARRRPPARRGT
jgi:hypothetical protein